jgi:2-amino-4-hydroxy-6-hydroxymethyldihydropteridine diphosphokinase
MGGNLVSEFGPPEATIRHALDQFSGHGITVRKISRLFQTPAFPAGSGPDFVNAAVLCQSDLSPVELLEALKQIEVQAGRVRHTRWGARTLDIDIIALGSTVLPDADTFDYWLNLRHEEQQQAAPDKLIVPHPRAHERAFVLIPLADVAPDWCHPVLGKTVAEMVETLPKDDLAAIAVLESA